MPVGLGLYSAQAAGTMPKYPTMTLFQHNANQFVSYRINNINRQSRWFTSIPLINHCFDLAGIQTPYLPPNMSALQQCTNHVWSAHMYVFITWSGQSTLYINSCLQLKREYVHKLINSIFSKCHF